MSFCKPLMNITVYEMHRAYCRDKAKGSPLRFGQYVMNMVYPSLPNSDLFYQTNDVLAMEYILTHYCDHDGNFKDIQ